MMGQQGSIEQSVAIARTLRRNNTAAERKLWRALRALNGSVGTRFRQQAPISRFVADGQHGEPDGLVRDAARTAWLKSRGYRVIRFSNTEVHTNLEGVMIAVMVATGTLPADSAVLPEPDYNAPPLTDRAQARLADPRSRSGRSKPTRDASFSHPHHPPHPSPPPQGGREFGRGRGGLQNATSGFLTAPTNANVGVPSPPAGEGQGGGDAAASAGDVQLPKAPA